MEEIQAREEDEEGIAAVAQGMVVSWLSLGFTSGDTRGLGTPS